MVAVTPRCSSHAGTSQHRRLPLAELRRTNGSARCCRKGEETLRPHSRWQLGHRHPAELPVLTQAPPPRLSRTLIGRDVPGRATIGRGRAGPEAVVRAAMDGSLSLSLDAAALEVMEALELLQQRREQLEQHLRQGWLSLAQARYSLGCHRVSSLQYGATMVPRVRVCHRQDPEGRPHFEEVPGTGGDPEDPDPQQGGGDGLRQRRGAPEKGETPSRSPPDPLGWFGVLVPPSLRQAQGSFQKGVTLAVEVAELQATMEAAATRYRQLLQEKRHLAGDSGDSQTPTGTPGDSKDTEGGTATSVTA